MHLRRIDIFAILATLLIVVVFGYVFFFRRQAVSAEHVYDSAQQALNIVIASRQAEILAGTDPELLGDIDEIHILTLGIDSRKEGNEKHCDAIHLVTFSLSQATITITSVPRGTFATLPPGKTYLPTDYYLSNACAFGGLDYGIAQVTKVTGVKPDYVVTIGFSEALGVFRVLDLPTTATLQWLRHRQSYAIGDPQRSQNQAVFMKDTAMRLFESGVPDTLFYLLYQFTGDAGADSAYRKPDLALLKTLFAFYRLRGIADQPERIMLTMKPYYATQELHLDTQHADTQVADLLESLRGRLSEQDLSFRTLEELQATLVAYLQGLITEKQTEEIARAYKDALWEQVEDDYTRERIHAQLLEQYVRDLLARDHDAAVREVTDYVLEMQYQELPEYVTFGEGLLKSLLAL